MTLKEAYEILGIAPNVSEEERLKVFKRQRERLEAKIAQSATPALKEKYIQSLERLEAAYELVDVSEEKEELPVLTHEESPDAKEEPEAEHVEAHLEPTSDMPDSPLAPPIPERPETDRKDSGRGIVLAMLALILLLGGLAYYFGYYHPAQEAQKYPIPPKELGTNDLSRDMGRTKRAEAAPASEGLRGDARFESSRKPIGMKTPKERRTYGSKAEVSAVGSLNRDEQGQGKESVPGKSGSLKIVTDPPDAEVSVDKYAFERTPVTLEAVAVGKQMVHISMAGYEDAELVVEVEENKLTDPGIVKLKRRPEKHSDLTPEEKAFLKAEARKRARESRKSKDQGGEGVLKPALPSLGRGGIIINTAPSGAKVTVGTFALERSPVILRGLKAGKHHVRITFPGYDEIEMDVEVQQDRFTDLGTIELVRRTGQVVIWSKPSGASVYSLHENNKLRGKTPLTLANVPTGKVRFALELPGWYLDQELSGVVTSGQILRLSANMKRYHIPKSAGNNITIPYLGMELIYINPGTFTREDDGQTIVTLTEGFWVSSHEVSQGQYERIMGNNPSRFHAAGPEFPVEQVSWSEAIAFCQKITERERLAGRLPAGYEYSLPLEVQWEYACRAGTVGRFCFGNSDSQLESYGWYEGNSQGRTHPVGQKKPNAWGLLDMHGNVSEWCYGWYSSFPQGRVTNPKGSPGGTVRVVRGGGWNDYAIHCASSYRNGGSPSYRDSYLGFRMALRLAE